MIHYRSMIVYYLFVTFLINRAYTGFLPYIREFPKAYTIFENHQEWFHYGVITYFYHSNSYVIMVMCFIHIKVSYCFNKIIIIELDWLNFCISSIGLVIRNKITVFWRGAFRCKKFVKKIYFWFKIRDCLYDLPKLLGAEFWIA